MPRRKQRQKQNKKEMNIVDFLDIDTNNITFSETKALQT